MGYKPSGKGDCAKCHRTWWCCDCGTVWVRNPDYVGRQA